MAHFSKSFDENYIVVNNKDLYRVVTSMSQLIRSIYLELFSRKRLKVRVTRSAFISKRKLFLNFNLTVRRNVPSIVSITPSVLNISYQFNWQILELKTYKNIVNQVWKCLVSVLCRVFLCFYCIVQVTRKNDGIDAKVTFDRKLVIIVFTTDRP